MVSSKSIEIRNILLDELKKDLVGPRTDEEVLPIRIPPTNQYLSGILFPLETKIDPDENERLSYEINDDGNDVPYEAVEQNIGIKPSSIGLTCNIKIDTKQIIAEVKFDRYVKDIMGIFRCKCKKIQLHITFVFYVITSRDNKTDHIKICRQLIRCVF